MCLSVGLAWLYSPWESPAPYDSHGPLCCGLPVSLMTPTGSLEQRPRPPSCSHLKRPFLLSLRPGSSISFPFLGLSHCFWVGSFLNSRARKHIVPTVHVGVSFTPKRVGLGPDWNKMFKPHVLWGSCDTFPRPSGRTGAPGATSPTTGSGLLGKRACCSSP